MPKIGTIRLVTLELTRHQGLVAYDLLANPLDREDPITQRLTRLLATARGHAERVFITPAERARVLTVTTGHLSNCKDGCVLDSGAAEILAQLTTPTTRQPDFDPDVEVLPGELYRYHMDTAPDLIVRVESTFINSNDKPEPGAHGQVANVAILAGGQPDHFCLSTMIVRAWRLQPLGA